MLTVHDLKIDLSTNLETLLETDNTHKGGFMTLGDTKVPLPWNT